MRIEIKNRKLLIDDSDINITDLTTELLDEILEKAIKQEVEFILEDTSHPVYNFFKSLHDDTMENSEFMKELKKLEQELTQTTT